MKKHKRNPYTSVPYPVIVLVAAIVLVVTTICGVVSGIETYKFVSTKHKASKTEEGEVIIGDAVVGDRINILLLGVDKSEMLSDTIMFVSINTKDKKVATMSILRDTHVKVGGYSYKINSLIGTKNREKATMEAVKSLIGKDVPINYYVTVRTKAFRDAIDMLGGVEFDVPHVPNWHSNGRRGMYYEDPVQDLHIAIPEGKQILDGEAAEGLVRFRDGYANADEERVKVQQEFLKAVVKQKLKPKYVNKIPDIFKLVSDNIETDISISEAFTIGKSILGMKMEDVQTFSMPGAAEYVGDVSYFIADTAETRELIEQYFMDPEE